MGAGGLGCPAAWALAEAGVGRLTILDPDVVECSNLPRQVLYGVEDVARSKAVVAGERLAAPGRRIEGLHAPLDETNEESVLADADLLLDATDGALTKDWLNALAVRRGLPLIHAAALRSEGRLLDVPAGGRPCLACLFGRLREESGRCADLGVWNGVVGATGFLAAAMVLRRLSDRASASSGYVMLDLESPRAVTLRASPSDDCPVCADPDRLRGVPLPRAAPCDVAPAAESPAARVSSRLDLREEVCPLNLLRARRAVEDLAPGDRVEILLGDEGVASVPDGLRSLGHAILEESARGRGARLLVARGGRASSERRLERDLLLRYARQVVLPEVGEAGQARLLEAHVRLAGTGALLASAACYLSAAGVGRVDLAESPGEGAHATATVLDLEAGGREAHYTAFVDAEGGGRVVEGERAAGVGVLPLPEAYAMGALLADRVERRIVLGRAPGLAMRIVSGPCLEA